jgi:hypothetical protein
MNVQYDWQKKFTIRCKTALSLTEEIDRAQMEAIGFVYQAIGSNN